MVGAAPAPATQALPSTIPAPHPHTYTPPDAPRQAGPPSSPPRTPSTSAVTVLADPLHPGVILPAAPPPASLADKPRAAATWQLYAPEPAPPQRPPSLASIMKANGLAPDINARLCMMHSALVYAAFGRAVAGMAVKADGKVSRTPEDVVISLIDALTMSVTDLLRCGVVSGVVSVDRFFFF